MAIYTHYEVANSPSAAWKDVLTNSYTATQTLLKFVNTDGTLTKVHGSFIIINGNVLDGIITSLEHTTANGVTVYELITGLTAGVNPFLADPLFARIPHLLGGQDTLYGFSGHDYLDGGAGTDAMYGGAGKDELHGSGTDTLVGGMNDDTYQAYAGDKIVEADGGGIDTLVPMDNMTLPDNVENLEVGIWYSTIHGNGLDNNIVVNGYIDTVYGGAGNDTFTDNSFTSTFRGETGDDSYYVSSSGHIIELPGEGRDQVITDAKTYTLEANVEDVFFQTAISHIGWGNEGDNLLLGAAGKDELHGLGGEDHLSSAGGGDFLYGGAGDDTYSIVLGDTVVELANEGIDTVWGAGGLSGYTLPDNVENLVVNGEIGIGNALDNVIRQNAGGATTFYGMGGNDTLIQAPISGGWMDGGEGDDTGVYYGKLAKWSIVDRGDQVFLQHEKGSQFTAVGIEHFQFEDGTLDVNDGNPLFDTAYYMTHNLDVWNAGANALDHFNTSGWHEGRDPNAWFDSSGYLAVNKDVAASGQNPLEHYHNTGWQQGRDPGADFDTTLYLINNPDVAASGADPLQHFLQFGQAEGRQAYQAIGQNIAGGFDAQYYLLHNPDVAAAGVDPLQHFNQSGWHEGRNPNGWFDTSGYLAHYSDVAASGVNPLQHYEQFGWHEGRDPSAQFDTLKYLAANPDVAAGGTNPLDHFLSNGIYEGRSAMGDGLWH